MTDRERLIDLMIEAKRTDPETGSLRKLHKKYEEMNKMCDLCNSYPHLPGCPNAPEPKGLTRCDDCGQPIYDGEEYVEADGYMYHESCLEVMSTRDIIEALGREVRTMEYNDCYI